MIGLFVIALISHTAYGLDCAGKPNGAYDIGCKQYSTCTNGVLSTHECSVNMVYNNITKACDYTTNVLPPCGLVRDCSKIADGSYSDLHQNCTSYYTCSHHIYFGHNFCTPGTVFDDVLKTCVWPNMVLPPCGTKAVVVG